MDIFVEQIVKKEASGKTIALKVIIGIAAAIICVISVFLMLIGFAIALFIALGALYGAYYLMTNLDVEYEYIVTNGEIDVDKIIAQRKRKRLLTVKASNFEHFGKLADAAALGTGVTVINAEGTSANASESYYADFTHSAFGNVRLIFTPEEKVIDAVKPYFSRNLRIEYDRKY